MAPAISTRFMFIREAPGPELIRWTRGIRLNPPAAHRYICLTMPGPQHAASVADALERLCASETGLNGAVPELCPA